MVGVVGLVAVAPIAVRAWLPTKAAGIETLLPVFCAEQALLIAAIPSLVLLQAVGRFGLIGAIQSVQAMVGVTATLILMPRLGAIGFAIASVCSTAMCLAPGLLVAEYTHWSAMGARPSVVLVPRLALAAAASMCAPAMAISHALAAAVALVVLVVAAVHALWLSRRNRSDARARVDSGPG
jgi:O-antigen/teichoic acid export membrane protein